MDSRAEYVSCFGSGSVRRRHSRKVRQFVCRRVVPHQDRRQRRRRPTSGGSSTTRPVSTARASTSTAPRSRSSGRSSKASRTCSTRPSGRNRRFPSGSRSPTLPTSCRRRFGRSRGRSSTPTTCRFCRASGHGGSHPHLVHEFVRALLDDRDPWPNAATSANWTCVGILAHESATFTAEKSAGLPEFTFARNGDSKPAAGPAAPHARSRGRAAHGKSEDEQLQVVARSHRLWHVFGRR